MVRLLVMGDNHGDAESLRRVLADVEDESFDLAIHVGDFTNAWRTARAAGDERTGERAGVEQLEAVEPLLAELDARAEAGLLWVWGNQDYFGDLGYEIDAGTRVPIDGRVERAGLRFTNDPNRVDGETILVSHMEHWRLVDHFAGRAHFCGNTHRGRHRDRRLNAAFLQLRHPETDEKRFGGYFVVELDDAGLDVEMRSIGSLERRECERHRERGVQFQPAGRDCMYCRDQRILMRELSGSAFYGCTEDSSHDTVAEEALLDAATALWDDPPSGFREDLASYLASVDDDRYGPLARTDDGRLALADLNYAY